MKNHLCIGTYTEEILFGTGERFQGKGKGIYLAAFENGEVTIGKYIPTLNPSYLCIDEICGKLYSVNETKEYLKKPGGGVTQFSYCSNGEFRQEVTLNVQGNDPCHIVKSPDGSFLVISNFASGSITICYLDKAGNLTGKTERFQHEGCSTHPIRQKAPHAHSAIFSPDNALFYVPDLGIDCIKAYRLGSSKILAAPELDLPLPRGSGPRFGEFSADGKHFYLINELASQVMHFRYENGHMTFLEAVSTLPEDFTGENICSDLHITPDQQYLYASNRGHDSIVCYRLDTQGYLHFIERVSSGGKTPRNFCIDPEGNYLLAGNQDSDTICIFQIQSSGHLTYLSQTAIGSPVCIKFFYMPF